MKNNDFEFNYTAPTKEERMEIESIKKSYLKQNAEPSKLDYLRKLNSKVKNIPTMFGLIFGIVGTLIFGLGLSFILEWNLTVWGIVICAVGIVPIALAMPIYNRVSKNMKEKYADEIIRISDELLND